MNEIVVHTQRWYNKIIFKALNIDNKKVNSVVGAGGSHVFKLCKFTFSSNLLFLSKYKQKFAILKNNSKFYFYQYRNFFDLIL
jgi:hypothetical protein